MIINKYSTFIKHNITINEVKLLKTGKIIRLNEKHIEILNYNES